MDDSLALLRLAADDRGRETLRYRDRAAIRFAEAERLTVADAFTHSCRDRSAGHAVAERRRRPRRLAPPAPGAAASM